MRPMNRLSPPLLAFVLALAPAALFAQEQEKVVLGKLGQAIEATKLYKSASTKSHVYYRLKQYEYIVINSYKDDSWLLVLLENGDQGFVLSDKVARLPYNVTMPKANGTASDVQKALEYSFNYVGTPYKWGGNDITKGIDCSAFVKDVFAQIGVKLPRTAAEQYKVGKPVTNIEELKPGDRLYFWDKKRGLIGHTGIFVGFREDGGAYFIHSSANNKGVATDDLRNQKWRKLLVAARR
ncbi:MAG: C40 family peptidase [Armatimonadetes bacterium]|nr:C40 family peptidase [Armatimonadota bacterium]